MLVTRVNEKNYPDFNFRLSLAEQSQVKKKDDNRLINVGVAAASVGATLLGVLAVRKSQGLNLERGALKGLSAKDKFTKIWKSFDIDYGVKDMLLVGSGSALGGLLGGFAFDKKGDRKKKITEGVFKVSNITIPTLMTASMLKIFEKLKFKNKVTELVSVAFGVGFGMLTSSFVTNKINKKIDKNFEEKKLKPKDFLVHIDDIVGALFITKAPFVNTLHMDKLLTAIYAWGGYETGRAEDKKHISVGRGQEDKPKNNLRAS